MTGTSKRGIRFWMTVCLVVGLLTSGLGLIGITVGLFSSRTEDARDFACGRSTPVDFDGVLEAIRVETYTSPIGGYRCVYPYASGQYTIDDHIDVSAFGLSMVGLTALIISLVGLPMTLVRRPPVGVMGR